MSTKIKVVKKWCNSGATRERDGEHGSCKFIENYKDTGSACVCNDGDILSNPYKYFEKKFGKNIIYKDGNGKDWHIGVINWNKVNIN